ncbi:unnamed protein product [Cyprideis torosa]|uniref:valine--tRNA ligase n=1 Tax=Cyprideis torosa TaxID=163714 RepID=A0A7R8WS37_9CRUS|nr:unnamed protein product [Cyprideis torosa]CAG0904462.1 unnamed protein product [Cyprideis torosa]
MVAADLLRPSIPRLRWLSRTISTSYGGRRERLSASDAMPQKELSSEFPAIYNSGEVEQGWPEFWERVLSRHKEQGLTASQKEARENFSLLLPPPNVTGTLHLGHALGVTIQDALVKW